jgi:hypothetical protein
MVIKYIDGDGNFRTQGGGDPKVKVPVAGLVMPKTSGIGRTELPDNARMARLEARMEALEQLVHALAASVKESMSRIVAELTPLKELLTRDVAPVTKPSLVTKPSPVTKPSLVTKHSKGGRPAKGDCAMTAAERMRALRARKIRASKAD